MTWLEEFEIWLESQTMSTHTIKSYVGDLRQFSDWMGKRQGEDFEAGKLTAVDVRAYQKALQGMKRHPATVNRKINALRTFARFASGKYTGGSIQEESYYINTPCCLLRNATERREGLGENVLISGLDGKKISGFLENYKSLKRKPIKAKFSPSSFIVGKILEMEKEWS